MSKSVNLRDGFVLDGWLIEPEMGRVSHGGIRAQLEPKIMEVLVLLAENQPEVVRKETFFNTVWHDVNVIDHVLARAISEIRRALRDEPRNPKFIQTIPKIGYQLMVPVTPRTVFEPIVDRSRNEGALVSPRAWRPLVGNLAFFFAGILTIVIFLAISVVVLASGGGHHHP